MILMATECLVLQSSVSKSNEHGTLDINPINNKIVYIQISRKSEAFSVKFSASSKTMIHRYGEKNIFVCKFIYCGVLGNLHKV